MATCAVALLSDGLRKHGCPRPLSLRRAGRSYVKRLRSAKVNPSPDVGSKGSNLTDASQLTRDSVTTF